MNPTEAGNQDGNDWLLDISIAGTSKDQTEAAIITPAEKPSMLSRNRRFTPLVKNIRDAPSAVIHQVNVVATSACQTGLSC